MTHPVRHLSHTAIQAYLACPRRFEWRYVRRLKKARKAGALRMGSLYHHGLDLLKSGSTPEDAVATVWRLYDDVPGWIRYPEDFEKWHIERETTARLLTAYAYFTEPLDVVATEHELEVPIRNPATSHATPRFRFRGTIDAVIRLGGRLALLEHKTTSRDVSPGSDYLRRLRLDSQVSRYLIAAQLAGINATRMIYDITVKPTIRPKRLTKKAKAELEAEGTYHGQAIDEIPESLDRETPEMFGARLTLDICRRPEHCFRRFEVARLVEDLVDEQKDLWFQQQDIARAIRTGRFHRNTDVCLRPYRCAFADLCLNGETPESLAPGRIPDGYRATNQPEET